MAINFAGWALGSFVLAIWLLIEGKPDGFVVAVASAVIGALIAFGIGQGKAQPRLVGSMKACRSAARRAVAAPAGYQHRAHEERRAWPSR
jgi:hypothetical protein